MAYYFYRTNIRSSPEKRDMPFHSTKNNIRFQSCPFILNTPNTWLISCVRQISLANVIISLPVRSHTTVPYGGLP